MPAGFRDENEYVNGLASLVDSDGRRRPPRPVTIVQYTGPPRSGKSELLRELEEQFKDWTPVAAYDFAHTSQETRNDQVLNLLAFQLAGPRREFGRLAFPRLYATLIALKTSTDKPSDRDAAVREIQLGLEDPRAVAWVRSVMESLATEATNLLPPLPGGKSPGAEAARTLAPDVVLAALRRSPRAWRLLSAQARNGLGPWPGMITDPRRLGMDGMDAVKHTLASMQVYRESGQMLMLSEAERQPWAAFLQDIRAGYPRSGRNLCAILVLRNVDLPTGRRFIRALTAECAERRRLGADDVPLIVLAAGRQPVAADYPDWKIETRQPPGLSATDIRDLALREDAKGITAAQEAVAALSGGHRGIAEAMIDLCARSNTYPYALTPGVPVRGELLPGVDDGDFEKLVSCAPAIDVRQVERIILAAKDAGQVPDASPGADLRRTLGELGWLRGAEIHPGIRTLLLWHLARRPADHEWSWAKACQRLRNQPPDQMRTPGRPPSPGQVASLESPLARAANQAYYDLAAGDIGAAVNALESIGTEGPEWTAAFDWVTAAPQPSPVWQEPRPLAEELAIEAIEATKATGLLARLTRLVVTCWLGADRQLDPWHELDQDIAYWYREARPLGGELFVQRAKHYEDEAARWLRIERDRHPRPTGDTAP